LERDHRPILSAGGQFNATHRHDLPRGASQRKKTEESADAVLANSGYAFAVADNTWHSADPVGPEVKTRDSILLTYFVDAGPWRFVRNRGRRLANFVLNETRNLKRN